MARSSRRKGKCVFSARLFIHHPFLAVIAMPQVLQARALRTQAVRRNVLGSPMPLHGFLQ